MELKHGRAVTDTGNLLIHCIHILTRQVVRCADIVWTHDDAAGVLHFDFVWAERGDRINRVLLAGESNNSYEHDRGRADHHTEHREQEARLTRAKAVVRKVQRLPKRDGGTCAAQGIFESVSDSRHKQKKSKWPCISIAGQVHCYQRER